MLVVTEPNHVPPGGSFVAKHPISGREFRAHTIDVVWQRYNEHSRTNNYPEVNRQQIVDNICEHTKANICHDTEAPTVAKMMRTFVTDVTEWSKAGFPASKAVAELRLEICKDCPWWHGLSGGSYASGRCGKCGCSGLKLAMHTTKCPIGKWSAVT